MNKKFEKEKFIEGDTVALLPATVGSPDESTRKEEQTEFRLGQKPFKKETSVG